MAKRFKSKITKRGQAFDTTKLADNIRRGVMRSMTSGAFERVVVIRILWDFQLKDATKRESDKLLETFRDTYNYEIVDISLPTSTNNAIMEERASAALLHLQGALAETARKMTKVTDHIIFYYRGHGGSLSDEPDDLILGQVVLESSAAIY